MPPYASPVLARGVTTRWLGGLAVVLAACHPAPPSPAQPSPAEPADTDTEIWYPDADGDGFGDDGAGSPTFAPGYVEVGGDCDDTDPNAWPGAPEACDGRDNDCDGAADEEPTVSPPTWYPDEDGDGFGQAGGGVSRCLPPEVSGWTQDATDCDDGDTEIHPGAPERCNGADDDCDGETDEAPVEGAGWFPDMDGDGFGDDGASICTFAPGYVDVDGDCDDTNADVHPAAVEVCNDGADNDCDGSPGDCVWGAVVDMTAQLAIRPAYEDESFGYTGGAGDLDGDGRPEVLLGAPEAYTSEDGLQGGAVAVFRGPITRDLGFAEAAWTFYGEEHYGGLGSSLLIHDLDGDGFDDLQIGAGTRTVDGIAWAGTLYTMLGPLTAGGVVDTVADWKLVGSEYNESIGEYSYALGDLDGDGLADFGTGFELIDYGGLQRNGAVYVFTSVGTGTEAAEDAATALIYGSNNYDYLGRDAAGLDLDGDGVGDLVVGVAGLNAGPVTGAALVYLGPVSGHLAGNDADLTFTGESYASYAGEAVESVGDVNGDGLDDMLVGGPQTGDGAAYLLWGSPTLRSGPMADANVKFRGDRVNYHQLGYRVSGLGDLDGDGWPDIFLSENYSTDAQGYVFFGPFDTPATHYSSSASVVLAGNGRSDSVFEVAFTPGDITGDEVSDLVIGSYKHGATDWDGIAYIIPGVGY